MEDRILRVAVVGLLAAIAVLAFGAVGAEAHSSSIPSTVEIRTVTGDEDAVVSGVVDSQRPRCEVGRRVNLLAREAISGFLVLVDVDLTSQNGAWAGRADLSGASSVTAAIPRVDVGRGDHVHICTRDTDVASPN